MWSEKFSTQWKRRGSEVTSGPQAPLGDPLTRSSASSEISIWDRNLHAKRSFGKVRSQAELGNELESAMTPRLNLLLLIALAGVPLVAGIWIRGAGPIGVLLTVAVVLLALVDLV